MALSASFVADLLSEARHPCTCRKYSNLPFCGRLKRKVSIRHNFKSELLMAKSERSSFYASLKKVKVSDLPFKMTFNAEKLHLPISCKEALNMQSYAEMKSETVNS